jgi:hypothetical protein
MLKSGDAVHCDDKISPTISLLGEHFLARGGQAIEATAALIGFLDPATLYPPTFFEAIEQRVERSNIEANRAL